VGEKQQKLKLENCVNKGKKAWGEDVKPRWIVTPVFTTAFVRMFK
jgi:hypothetical protein